MICPKCGSERAKKNGSMRGICPGREGFQNGRPHSFMLSPEDILARVTELQLARQGEGALHHALPGQQIKGVSTLVDPQGNVKAQWVKTTRDEAMQHAMMHAAALALADEIPRAAPLAGPAHTIDELLNQYTITDYHLGMLAWGEETGDDWDTQIAEDLLVDWFSAAIALAPAAKTGVFAQLGDFLHWDGLEAVTPTSKHVLDADTRFQKLVRVAIRVIRRVVDMLLAKHENVIVLMAEGNHDIASSTWLRELFWALYEHEPRIVVITNPDPYYCIEHGQTALFYHHGHKKKFDQLETVFVAKFREIFGRTKHAYAHTGHLHHDVVKETNLMILEQHRTLAASDAHASRGGWMSGRDAKVITYHSEFGEVGRLRLSDKMVARAKAA